MSRERIVDATMLPPAAALTDVLPAGDLRADGRPTGELREHLYRIPNGRNALHVVTVWLQSAGMLWLASLWDNPVGWVLAFLLMGPAMVRFAILMHEAAHRLLFTKRSVNDWVGRWLVAYPAFVPIDTYRRGHMAHHREEFGPNEPDILLYAGYPIPSDSWRRKLLRDAFGNSGWKNLKALLLAVRSPTSRSVAVPILCVQALLFLGLWALTGKWWMWPVMWLLPWMTTWRVLNRLRAVAEHGGLERSADRRVATHHVRQSALARLVMVPLNTGHHLAHHVDIGVPMSRLPQFQAELERSGYITPELEWPNYRTLWRHAHSGAAAAAQAGSSGSSRSR